MSKIKTFPLLERCAAGCLAMPQVVWQCLMIVVIINDNIPLMQCSLTIIEKPYSRKDGTGRVAKIGTKNGSFTRPLVKLGPPLHFSYFKPLSKLFLC